MYGTRSRPSPVITAVAQLGVIKSGSNERRSFNICCRCSDALDFERSREDVLLASPPSVAAAAAAKDDERSREEGSERDAEEEVKDDEDDVGRAEEEEDEEEDDDDDDGRIAVLVVEGAEAEVVLPTVFVVEEEVEREGARIERWNRVI